MGLKVKAYCKGLEFVESGCGLCLGKLKKYFWTTQVLFCGAADTPVGIGVSVICSLRFTSGVTPANLLVTCMGTESFSSTYLQAGIGGV